MQVDSVNVYSNPIYQEVAKNQVQTQTQDSNNESENLKKEDDLKNNEKVDILA
ncbi:MAG TPA: hypothetical protein PK771_02240 [Spirochaetota bacterium]|nr:hypothetical protein [Spirochaetota bacterium]